MVSIKQLGPDNAALLAEVAAKSYLEHFKYLWQDEGVDYVSKSFNVAFLREDISSKENLYFGAYLNEDIVGFLKLRPYNTLPMFSEEDAFEIERIYLVKAAQGKGVGKALMNLAVRLAVERNKKIAWLKVMDSNLKTIAFYKKMGFVKCGTVSLDLPLIKDEYRGMFIMKRHLSEGA